MHHDVRATACCLIIRQCHGEFGVHYRKSRAAVITAVSALNQAFLLGYNRGIAHLASRCRNGQDDAQRKAAAYLTLIIVVIPYITFICDTVSDSLGRIDRTSAAYSQEKIDIFFFAEFNAFVNKSEMRIRNSSS